MEIIPNQKCPRCRRTELNIYYSTNADEKLGAWCQNCDLRAYFNGQELVSMNNTERLAEAA
jgi:hypothetical protein